MRKVRQQLRVLGTAFVAVAFLVAAASIAGHLHGHGAADLLRDPLAVAGAPWYLGFLSNVGILLWWPPAAVCATAAVMVTRIAGRSDDVDLLAAAAGVTAILALDDLFQIHEHFQLPVYALYVVLLAYCARRFLTRVARTRWFTLAVAVSLLSGSVLVDVATEHFGVEAFAAEDLLKLFGIVAWCVYFVRLSFRVVDTAAASVRAEARAAQLRRPAWLDAPIRGRSGAGVR